MGKSSGEVLAEAHADIPGKGARPLHPAPEFVRVLGRAEDLEPGGAVGIVRAHQVEAPQIRDQHQPVAAPIAPHLIGHSGRPGIVTNALDLDDATLGNLPRPRTAPLNLPRRVQAEVGMAGPLVRQFLNAEHLGLERGSDRAQQVLQRRIVGALPGRPA